jgi:DNA/RNA endonuclease YhcR with UshA esterase domain
MKLRYRLTAILFTTVLIGSAFAQSEKKIPASQAAQHVGEKVTVCGYVASTRYLSSSRSKPTFLNFSKPYPDEDFTVVIWPEDRAKFGEPESKYLHKNICVVGEITLYRGGPQITARNPSQIHEE